MILNSDKIAEIKARLDAASPGPWVLEEDAIEGGLTLISGGICITPTKQDEEFLSKVGHDIQALIETVKYWQFLAEDNRRLVNTNIQILEDELAEAQKKIKKIKDSFSNEMGVSALCIMEEIKHIITKNDERMAFIRCSDLSGSIEAVAFPRVLKEANQLFQINKPVIIKGRVSLRNGEKSLIIEKVKNI